MKCVLLLIALALFLNSCVRANGGPSDSLVLERRLRRTTVPTIAIPQAQPNRPIVRTASQSPSLKSSFKPFVIQNSDSPLSPDARKRVRFFLHEDGDASLVDTLNNEYVSTDEETDEHQILQTADISSSSPQSVQSPHVHYEAPQTLQQRQPRHVLLLGEDDEVPWLTPEAEQTHRMRHGQHRDGVKSYVSEHLASDEALHTYSDMIEQQQNMILDFGNRPVASNAMTRKRKIISRIEAARSKIAYLTVMIQVQKQERANSAAYNIKRLNFRDYKQHKNIWNDRLRLLKSELNRQKEQLADLEREKVSINDYLLVLLNRIQTQVHNPIF